MKALAKVSRDNLVRSTVSRILIVRIKGMKKYGEKVREEGSETPSSSNQQKPRSNYHANKANLDVFSNYSLIGLPDATQEETVRKVVDAMSSDALAQCLPIARFHNLRMIVMERIWVFRIDFSQSSASIPSLRLEIKPEEKPVHVKMRRESNCRKKYLRTLVYKLLEAGLVYPNPPSK